MFWTVLTDFAMYLGGSAALVGTCLGVFVFLYRACEYRSPQRVSPPSLAYELKQRARKERRL